MKQSTLNALRQAYNDLQQIVLVLYEAFQEAFDNNDYIDASLLESRADKLYEEVLNIETLLLELEE